MDRQDLDKVSRSGIPMDKSSRGSRFAHVADPTRGVHGEVRADD